MWFYPQILHANDMELNRWCSLKKTCMFRYCCVLTGLTLVLFSCHLPREPFSFRTDREEVSDLKNYKIKAQNEKKRREILHSVYAE